MDWFLYDNGPRHERVKGKEQFVKNTTFGLGEKNDSSTTNKVFKNTNERTYDYLCYSCYFANSFTLKHYPILRGGYK